MIKVNEDIIMNVLGKKLLKLVGNTERIEYNGKYYHIMIVEVNNE